MLARLPLLLVLFAGLSAGCALQTHPPAPLDPAGRARDFAQRRLDTAEVRDFLASRQQAVSPWPPQRWPPDTLALAALPGHPAMRLAQARRAAAEAALKSAGLRAPVRIEPLLEHHSESARHESWSVGVALDLPLTGQTQALAREARAQALLDAAVIDEAQTAWTLRMAIWRSTLAGWAIAREQHLVATLETLQQQAVQMVEQRLAVGAADALALGQVRRALADTTLRRAELQRAASQAQADLALALALPLSAVHTLEIDTRAFDPAPMPPEPEAMRIDALHERNDLRRALLAYAAAEAALAEQIAAQFPELRLKPGLLWDQGDLIWSIGLNLPVFAAERQRGPIAEALARRQIAEQEFLALQAGALTSLHAAHTRLAEHDAVRTAAQTLRDDSHAQAERSERRFAQGEADRLELTLARAEALRAELAGLQAQRQWLEARLALEEAVQRPLAQARPHPSDPGSGVHRP